MMRASPRQLVLLVGVLSACSSLGLFLFLPYDSAVLAYTRFAAHKSVSFFGALFRNEQWLLSPAQFPVDLDADVAFIIKTGYATQHRVSAQLDALDLRGSWAGDENILVLGDFSTQYTHNGRDIKIFDMVSASLQHEALSGLPDSERMRKYKNLTAAISSGNDEEARELGKAFGWELDALKFLPGLQLAYDKLPQKKWYIMLDDDTYLVKPSLRLVLGHVDASKPMYLGGAVGDYKARFAHGGSSVIISHAAMARLLDQHRAVLAEAYRSSLTETWGDKLVATTFMKSGVFIDERFSHYFNGERPLITKIRPGRFCSPLISFHGLAEPSQMSDVGRIFGSVDQPVRWSDLWKIYGQPGLDSFEAHPIRPDKDHVGRLDEAVVTARSDSAEACLDMCKKRPRQSCVAWTWDREQLLCHNSPWVIVGSDKDEGKYSGLNLALVKRLVGECEHATT